MRLDDIWSRFENSTGIHGFSEHRSMLNRGSKAVCRTAGRCWRLIVIYSSKRPQTTVSNPSDLDMPDIALWMPNTIRSDIESMKLRKRGASTKTEDLMGFLYSKQVMERQLCALVPDVFEKLPDNITETELRQWRQVHDDDVSAFAQNLSGVWRYGPIGIMHEHVESNNAALTRTWKKPIHRITGSGALHIVRLISPTRKQLTTKFIKRIQLDILKYPDARTRDLFLLASGAVVDNFGIVEGKEFRNPQFHATTNKGRYLAKYYITAGFKVYKRYKDYCTPRCEQEKVGCVELCMIDKAKKEPEKYCAPYKGDTNITKGLELCTFNWSVLAYSDLGQPNELKDANGRKSCEFSASACKIECYSCPKCKPCNEVRTVFSVTAIYSDKPNDYGYVARIYITPDHDDIIQLFETDPFYDTATFVSQVGGLLGLCFGASILSFIHLCYFCVASGVTVMGSPERLDDNGRNRRGSF